MKSNDDKITTFAPVVIPTLCRYDHFRQCIDSLMECTWAENTDVYIGLDYPAKEEHWEGYRKISAYLDSIVDKHKFKTLNIIRREKNYGLGRGGNAASLVDMVLKQYDSYIFSEDDNIFSPAFLDFINKGLEKYKDDERILAINGYIHFFDFKCAKDDTVFYQNYCFSAWGYGIWRDRRKKISSLSTNWFKSKGIIKSCYKILKNYGWERLFNYLTITHSREKNFRITDIALTLYMILDAQYAVVPKTTLVRNLGIDGSGENFKCVSNGEMIKYSTQPIFEGSIYPIVKKGPDYFRINNKIFQNNSISKISFRQFLIEISKATVKKIYKSMINLSK